MPPCWGNMGDLAYYNMHNDDNPHRKRKLITWCGTNKCKENTISSSIFKNHFTCSKSNFTYLQTWQVSSGNISGNVGDTATGKCLHAFGMQCIALYLIFSCSL